MLRKGIDVLENDSEVSVDFANLANLGKRISKLIANFIDFITPLRAVTERIKI